MNIELRDDLIKLSKGDMYVVPKGVEHKPFAEKECQIMLVEPKGIVNTGKIINDFTSPNDIWVWLKAGRNILVKLFKWNKLC